MRTEDFLLQAHPSAPYRIRLAIPEGAPPPDGWPVVTMLGDDAFAVGADLIRYHADCRPPGYIDAGLLVAVDYPDEDRRRLDYTPNADAGIATVTLSDATDRPSAADAACPPQAAQGGADAFLTFLLETLRPWLQARFPIDRQRQALAGHSLGGLFTLHALLTTPMAFQTWIVSSPSVWWGNRHLERRTAQLAGASAAAGTRCAGIDPAQEEPVVAAPPSTASARAQLWLSVGEYEQAVSPLERRQQRPDLAHLEQTRRQRAMIDGARAIAQNLACDPTLEVMFQIHPGQYHRSVWPCALGHGLLGALRRA